MDNDFSRRFMGENLEEEANDRVDNNFGMDDNINNDANNTFNGDNNFGEQNAGDDFTTRFGDNNFGPEDGGNNIDTDNNSSGGALNIAKGIVGALIATKLFSIIDRNGSISRLLGIDTGINQQQQQNGGGGNGNPGKARNQSGGIIGKALSIVGIIFGSLIIIVFVFYIISFFFQGGLKPDPSTGASESADLSPWVDRLTGKRSNELTIIQNKNFKDILPYKMNSDKTEIKLYFEDKEIEISYDPELWASRYDVGNLDEVGYLYVSGTMNKDGSISNIEPLGSVNLNARDSKEENFIKEENLKHLGLTKEEYKKIKGYIDKGIVNSWFKTKSERELEKEKPDEQDLLKMNSNGEMVRESNMTPEIQTNSRGKQEVIIKQPERNPLLDKNNSENSEDIKSELEKNKILNQMNQSGNISDEDYEEIKNKVLENSNSTVSGQESFKKEKKKIIVKEAESNNRERLNKQREEYLKEEEYNEKVDELNQYYKDKEKDEFMGNDKNNPDTKKKVVKKTFDNESYEDKLKPKHKGGF